MALGTCRDTGARSAATRPKNLVPLALQLFRCETCSKSSRTQKGPYDPTTAMSMKTSLKNRLRSFNFFAIIPSRSDTEKKGPYDPTTAMSMKTSLKNRLRSFNFFAIIPSRSDTEKKGIYVRAEERGPPPSSDRDARIYSLAVPFLK